MTRACNQNLYNPDAAAKLLTDNGWAKGSDGIWAKGGQRASFKWTVNTGNTRRENTQALVIPQMKALGFELVPDNVDAATYFQQKLPALDTELAMYIQTATPDPDGHHDHGLRLHPHAWEPLGPERQRLVQPGRHQAHARL